MLRHGLVGLLGLSLLLAGCTSNDGEIEAVQAQLAAREAEVADLTARLAELEDGPLALSKRRDGIRDTSNPGVQVQPVCVTYRLQGDDVEDCRDSLVASVSPPAATEMVQFRDAVFVCYEEVAIGKPLPACWSVR